MRIVADTNIVVSGLLWRGPPRQLLEAARSGEVRLFTSGELLDELRDVLLRQKFVERLERAGVSVDDLVFGYAALAYVVLSPPIAPVVLADPDDDEVLACAMAAKARYIVSGDRHLLDLQRHRGLSIVTARQLLAILEPSPSEE